MGVDKQTLVEATGIDVQGEPVGKPLRNDVVTVHYKARYEHKGQTKLYENTRRFLFGHKVTFQVGSKETMAGLDVGVQKMILGEKAKLCITPDLAFKEHGHKGPQGTVPPNATVLMDVELISIQRKGVEHMSNIPGGCLAC